MGLSNAERQRRYMKRLKAQAKAGAGVTRYETEIAALKAEIAALKAQPKPARKPVTKPADAHSEVARLKATIADLRRGLRYFQKRPDGKVDPRTFAIMQSRFHPDRVKDPEQKARYKTAFEVFGELRNRLVDEDQARIASEKDTLLGKKPEANKRQPVPPKPPRKLPVT